MKANNSEYIFKIFDKREFSNFSYKFSSWLMIVFGFLFFSLSIFNYFSPIKKYDWDVMKQDSMFACEEIARSKNFTVSSTYKTGIIDFIYPYTNYPYSFFLESENLLLRCGDFKLKTFCMGDKLDCKINGISMTIEYQKPIKINK